MQALQIPMQVKAVGDSGRFEGLAAVYGNVDFGGDIIQPGAFKELATNEAGKLTVLWQHKQDTPIGVAEVSEDRKGLRFVGDLVLDDPVARTAHAHMKAGSVRGMSIGYDVLPGGAEVMASGVRKLKALKLWEISVVTFGMNPEALIERVKSRPTNIREFERALRQLGYSQKQATAIASHGFTALADDEPSIDPDDLQRLHTAMQSFTSFLKGQ